MQAFTRVTLKLSIAMASVAAVLFKLRRIFLVVGVVATIWFGIAITNPDTKSTDGLLPLTLGLWVALALAIGYTLPRLPQAVVSGDGFGLRVRKRLTQAAYVLAMIAMLGLAGFACSFSLRTVSLMGP